MTSLDRTSDMDHVDAAFHYGGLLIRAVGYLAVFVIAKNYDFGAAMLTGVLAGDLLGQSCKVVTNLSHGLLPQLCELAFLGLIFLFVRGMLVWPDDPAMRAIAGLAAFGLIVGHVGGSMLTRLGPSELH